ncbi:MAG: 1-acyl-sn-glycerol-3-phosphate acyltransferase [Acidothermus sp.]|nr:1-acyl-sn-glycerol-3-phosphate acyltransferase [Acidothermus sp.]
MRARPGPHRGWFALMGAVVKPALYAVTRREWRGLENVPSSGPVLVVANHVTVVDPLTLAHALYDGARRMPRFLAKAELFDVPFVGMVLRRSGQIPVYRSTREAPDSLREAEAALRAGECVVIYPEGTCTRDPDGWPMIGKSGVARLALTCDVPVIPAANWGAHEILRYKSRKVHLFPRKRIQVLFGPPVDLSAYRSVDPTREVLREVTDLLMRRVAHLLGEIRGLEPPAQLFDPRASAPAPAGGTP